MTSVTGHRARTSWPHRPSMASQPASPTRLSSSPAPALPSWQMLSSQPVTSFQSLASLVTRPPPLPGAKHTASAGHKTQPVLNESGGQDGSEPSLLASSRFQRPGRPTRALRGLPRGHHCLGPSD